MNFKAATEEEPEPEIIAPIQKPVEKIEEKKETPAQVTQDDLFSAHDFDIKIDLEVPLPGIIYRLILIIVNLYVI